MIATILIWLGSLSFVLVGVGIFNEIFFVYGMGLTVAGLSLIVFAFIVRKDWKGYKRFQGVKFLSTLIPWVNRIFCFGLGISALMGASAFWQDVPAYINQDYAVLKGIPEEIEEFEDGEIIVTINDERLPLYPNPPYSKEELEGQYFTIHYLPNTDWIEGYFIEGEAYPK
ncbi:hypothetical protein [Halobacillus andaensis]|uniref:hypothetical protein n=1 Tax=Halobacillus andaensis TaxID=1176239 RepID=UPI003D7358A2